MPHNFLESFWKHHGERKRKKYIKQALPIIQAFLDEYGLPKRPAPDAKTNKVERNP